MSAESDALERARRDARIERRGVERHLESCRWCADEPCYLARRAIENAEAYERHLAAMEAGS